MSDNSSAYTEIQPRRITGINKTGLYTLVRREVGRFLNGYTQTLVAPMVTMLLFYAVFALAFGGIARHIGDVPYMEFLAPGLIMMTMAQNAFANTSSSLVISKVQGNIVDVLMPPLSPLEIYLGFASGAVLRGLLVGVLTTFAISFFVDMTPDVLWRILVFGFLGTLLMGSLGIAAGIWSEKFDHIAAVTNFIVTPLTFLSGTFYSVESLPQMWHAMTFFNPFFYMIDGFRFSFIGISDGSIMIGLIYLSFLSFAVWFIAYFLFKKGYKIIS